MLGVRFAGKLGEIRTGTQTSLRLHRLPVQPDRGQCQTCPRALADLNYKDRRTAIRTDLSSPAADRVTDSHRKASPLRLAPHETHTVALEKQLEGTRTSRECDPHPKVTPYSPEMVKSIADFLLYLFQTRKLQLSTIDGYRSTIAVNLGNSSAKMRISLVPWTLSTETDPRAGGAFPLETFPWCCTSHKALFETSLKNLTSKTVFLLALGLGKNRSEIHAWQNKNIRPQSYWPKVCLYPSSSFLSRNQLAKRVHTVWPQWLFKLLPKLWISHSSLIGPYIWSEPCATIWIGPRPQAEQGVGLCLLQERLRQKYLPLSPHGLSRQ